MSDRGGRIDDPAMAKAFAQGFMEGLAEIHSSDEPAWLVEAFYEGTKIRVKTLYSTQDVLREVENALVQGCAVNITPIAGEREAQPGEISAPNDDEIVDAEIVG